MTSPTDTGGVAVMDPGLLQALVTEVQTNCHISDARHAGDMTMCIYLLQMREFFRWEKDFAALESLPHAQLGHWLSAREALWESLENRPFEPLPLGQDQFGPFEVDRINTRLRPFGLVYGAGLTGPGRASFFLAQLLSVQERGGAQLLTSGREHARGIFAAPAALCGTTIYLRQESLTRWLWQKYESWTLRRPPGAFRCALGHYGYEQDGPLAVARLAAAQGESLVLHELGELAAGRLLGPRWQDLRSGLSCRSTELYLRAVRDHLADCTVTLPALLESGVPAAIDFWFANLEGLRAELFPLAAQAYAAWRAGDHGRALLAALAAGRTHWLAVCEQVLLLHAAHGEAAPAHIRRLLASGPARL